MERTLDTIIGIDRQNNSGGYFIENEEVHCYVAVEEIDKARAINKFYEIVRPYSSFCPCCGERWDGLSFNTWPAPKEGITKLNFREPEIGEVANCILHLLDGTKIRCIYVD
jgi:hypothetical protein